MIEGISLEGKGSEGEKVLLEELMRFKTSSGETIEKEESGVGGTGGKISGEETGIIVLRILSIFSRKK